MLNNDIVKLCEVLDKLCVDGYNTIDKIDIFDCLNNDFGLIWDNSTLTTQIKNLVDNKFIILKYQDATVLCLIFTEEGRELVRRIKIARQNEENSQKSKKKLKKELADSKSNPPAEEENASPTGKEIMSGLLIEKEVSTANFSKFKCFLYGLLGGVLGGGISGAIITLLVIFL